MTQTDQPHPEKAADLLKRLMLLSEKLIRIADQESQALMQRDVVALSLLQNEKERMTMEYVEGSGVFRARVNEFRNTNKAVLQKLDALQRQLGEKTKSNNKLLDRMKVKAEKTTQQSLLLAQEYAQSPRVKFSGDLQTATDEVHYV